MFLSKTLVISSRYGLRPPLFRGIVYNLDKLKSTEFRQALQVKHSSSMPPKPSKEEKEQFMYTIKFKEHNIKEVFKKVYSLYGPLFIACHIGVSLTSLGFFCSLVYLSIDLTTLLPDAFVSLVGRNMADMTGSGGKFVVAYAIHKILLPIRLGAAIGLTKYLAPKLTKFKSSFK